MARGPLSMFSQPQLQGGRMLLALSGWMDGGDVSTGTVMRLVTDLNAEPIARIDAEDFCLLNFPGSMEVASLFRPPVLIENGLIKQCSMPTNDFYADTVTNMVLFLGREPHLRWRKFGQCVFEVASRCGVEEIYFVGSFGGSVPHTRLPRLYVSASDEATLGRMVHLGLRPSNYQGPGSFVTYLMTRASILGIRMASIVAEIPGYLQGTNPLCIEVISRRLATLLNLPLKLDSLRTLSNEWETRVSEAVAKDEELTNQVRELEEAYDQELIESQGEESAG
ncbi:MAG: PAC2 family protein [Phycisphaeraceae bacterium]|nr:PAC2 family protein [Phycisphaeraceae bacterium]